MSRRTPAAWIKIGTACFLTLGSSHVEAQSSQCLALDQASFELKAKTAQLIAKYPKVMAPLLACAASATLISDKSSQMVYGLGCAALVCYNTDLSSCQSLAGEVISLGIQTDMLAKQAESMKCNPTQ